MLSTNGRPQKFEQTKRSSCTLIGPRGKNEERERRTRPRPLKGAEEEEMFPHPGKSTDKIRQNQKGASEAQRRAQ